MRRITEKEKSRKHHCLPDFTPILCSIAAYVTIPSPYNSNFLTGSLLLRRFGLLHHSPSDQISTYPDSESLFTSLRDGAALPTPSPIDAVEKDDDAALVNMVCVDLDEYARAYDEKATKKL